MPVNQLEKLFIDVFNPLPGETVLFITDVPHGDLEDYDQWHSRRQMAEESNGRGMVDYFRPIGEQDEF